MAIVTAPKEEPKDGAIRYLNHLIEMIERGDFYVEEFSASVDKEVLSYGATSRRRTRTLTIKEIKPHD